MKLKILILSFFSLLICSIVSVDTNWASAEEDEKPRISDLAVIGTVGDIEILIDERSTMLTDAQKAELLLFTKEVLSQSGLLETINPYN